MRNINKHYRQQLKQKYFLRRLKRTINESNGRYWINYKNPLHCEEHTIKQEGWNSILHSKLFRWFKTTSTPCSCTMCKGLRYDRAKEKVKINKQINNI